MFVDRLAESCFVQNSGQAFQSNYSKILIGNEKVFLFKPLTYMNNSGNAVRKAISFYKAELDKIIVVHDDIDLELGRVKSKLGGGSGGHNGIKSIDSQIGKNYLRIRIGVGRPSGNSDTSDYVTSEFKYDEKIVIENTIDDIIKIFDKVIVEGADGFYKYFRQ